MEKQTNKQMKAAAAAASLSLAADATTVVVGAKRSRDCDQEKDDNVNNTQKHARISPEQKEPTKDDTTNVVSREISTHPCAKTLKTWPPRIWEWYGIVDQNSSVAQIEEYLLAIRQAPYEDLMDEDNFVGTILIEIESLNNHILEERVWEALLSRADKEGTGYDLVAQYEGVPQFPMLLLKKITALNNQYDLFRKYQTEFPVIVLALHADKDWKSTAFAILGINHLILSYCGPRMCPSDMATYNQTHTGINEARRLRMCNQLETMNAMRYLRDPLRDSLRAAFSFDPREPIPEADGSFYGFDDTA